MKALAAFVAALAAGLVLAVADSALADKTIVYISATAKVESVCMGRDAKGEWNFRINGAASTSDGGHTEKGEATGILGGAAKTSCEVCINSHLLPLYKAQAGL